MRTQTLMGAFLLCVAVILTLASAGTVQAKVIMKLGYDLAEGSAYDTFAKVFKKEVEAMTNGEVKVKNFCCFKMGGEQEMFKKL